MTADTEDVVATIRRKTILIPLVLLAMLCASVPSAGATPQQHPAARYVSTTGSGSCEWAWNNLTTDDISSQVVFTSEAIEDGPNSCANHGYAAPRGTLSFEQDIYSYEAGRICNRGPRIANDYGPSNGMVTQWTTTLNGLSIAGTKCGFPGHYEVQTIVYALDQFTGRWEGGTLLGQFVILS